MLLPVKKALILLSLPWTMPNVSNGSSVSAFKLLLILVVTFSLASLSGPLAALVQLPSLANISTVHATSETGVGSWYPAGAQEQTLSISQGDGSVSTQVNWVLTNQVDSEDWPLTATQQGASSVNCSANAHVQCI